MRGGAIWLAKGHASLKGVGVRRGLMRGLIRARHIQYIAKLGEEKHIIGALLAAFAPGPAREESFKISCWH